LISRLPVGDRPRLRSLLPVVFSSPSMVDNLVS
jgi:hypothetical protein